MSDLPRTRRVAAAQTERKKRVTGGDRDVLPAVDLIGDGARRDLSSETRFPEQRAGARVQRVEISFTPAGEEHVRRGREDAAVGDVGHLETPHGVSRPWIDR